LVLVVTLTPLSWLFTWLVTWYPQERMGSFERWQARGTCRTFPMRATVKPNRTARAESQPPSLYRAGTAIAALGSA
jgi:hypothetical protein